MLENVASLSVRRNFDGSDATKSHDADCVSITRESPFSEGKALLEKDCLDDAIKHLHRANDLAREQKLNFGDDIAFQLRLARKKRWNVQEERRIHQEIELQTYLNRLIIEDKERKSEELRKTGEDVDVLVRNQLLC